MYTVILLFFWGGGTPPGPLYGPPMSTSLYSRGVNRAGPNAGRAAPGRAERFYNLLEIQAELFSVIYSYNKVNGNSALYCQILL